jgi:hydrogenase expression/formation protein HypD
MSHLGEHRDPAAVKAIQERLASVLHGQWRIMEVCGGQTHAFMRFGLVELLPPGLELIHGPGCPVCVTSAGAIEQVVELSSRQGVAVCTFGDMLRVPGTHGDLLSAKARGGDVRMIYSPTQVLEWAVREPEREFVVFAVGFETTAPNYAIMLARAAREGIQNVSVLSALVLVPPVLRFLLNSGNGRIHGLLAPGHVCAITGYEDYEEIAAGCRLPIAVTGFEPVDLMRGLLECVRMLEEGRGEVHNAYPRAVHREGNLRARELLREVFQVEDRFWRGIGWIPQSGYGLKEDFSSFDAVRRFGIQIGAGEESAGCISGRIMQGLEKPTECPMFGTVCTPEHPLGPTMVSSEGACAAYHRFGLQGSGA